ncbi:MAG: T9SS type A sorting domain-containing protein [Candidatus Poribacteria bacterium]|nr:T9SS type A sorting domain-containing protein [Candidatus Poribacteria bacterium]
MKSKMFILLLSVLLISLFSSNVFSEDTDPRIGLYYRLSPKDDTVSIDVFIQSASNVSGCQVWLTYNPAVLDYVDEVFEEGDYFPANAFYGQRQLESLSDTETRLRFAVASAPIENKKSGIIATLIFKALNVEENLSLSLVDGDLKKGTGTLFSDAAGSLSLPSVVEPDDHSNIPAGATPIDINLGQATISSSRSSNGKIDYESDVDYFKIEVTSPGELTVYSKNSSIEMVGQLLDLNGDPVEADNSDGAAQNFRIDYLVTDATLSNPKTYYVEVTAFHNNSTGDYRFYAELTSLKVVKDAIGTTSTEWRIPEGLISEVAYGENSTYFVFTPGLAEHDTAVGYKNIITLDIPGTYDFDKNKTVQELLDDIKAMSDSPAYFMFPLDPPDANELAEAISEIEASEDETPGSVFKAYLSYLLEAGSFTAGIFWKPVGLVLGGIKVLEANLNFHSTLFNYLSGYFSDNGDNGYLSTRFSELADNDDGKIILETFLKVYENPSQEIETPYEGNLIDDIPKFLIMIPKREPDVTIAMDQHFFRHDSQTPITINEVPSEEHFNPDGSLGSVLQFQLQLNQKIIIIKGDYSKPLKNFLQLSFDGGFPNTGWEWEYSDGKLVWSDEDREDIQKLLTNIYHAVVFFSMPVGDIPVVDLNTVSDPNSPDFSVPRADKIDLPIPLAAYSSNTLAAPHAQRISLADYPPFQQLPPEIQAYLLQHFEGTANLKATNAEMWQVPEETSLLPNYPNPFNPETWIPYQLATPADVTLTIYDLQGRVVRDLDLGQQRAGMYHSRNRAAYWDGRNAQGESVASGVYFYTLTAGDFTATRKLLIRK